MQLAEALPGFNANAALASGLGMSVADTLTLITAGGVDATTGINALIQGMAKFPGAAGAMAAQSQTLTGVFSTFKDTPELNPVPNTNPVQTLAADQWGLARVYADGKLRFTRELRSSGAMFRLPSGFKAQFWQVEIEARVKVLSIELATSAKELGSV